MNPIKTKPETRASPETSTTPIMKACVLKAPRQVTIGSLPLLPVGEKQIRIRMEGCGVCASSLPVWQGRDWFYYPLHAGEPGHEGWGVVEEVGSEVKDLQTGDRVCTLHHYAFSTHVVAEEEDTIKLPSFLDGKHFPGEPLGCAANIFSRSKIKRGETVAIIGAGFLGLLLLQLAKAEGAQVLMISRREFSLEMARQNGADHVIPLDKHEDIIQKVAAITHDHFCDCVVEATGKEWPLNLAIELTKVRGRLVVVGFHQDGLRQVNMQLLNWRGIDMINAHEREKSIYLEGIRKAIDAIAENRMDPFQLITHQYDHTGLANAFEDLEKRPGGFIKGIITYDKNAS